MKPSDAVTTALSAASPPSPNATSKAASPPAAPPPDDLLEIVADGPDKFARSRVVDLGGAALVALGKGPDGPWRICVTANPWKARINERAPYGVVMGACLWFTGRAFAERANARCLLQVAALRARQNMREPLFLAKASAVQAMFEAAAKAERAELGVTSFQHADWVAKANGGPRRKGGAP